MCKTHLNMQWLDELKIFQSKLQISQVLMHNNVLI